MSIADSTMTVTEAIDARRSVRSYAPDTVARASVRRLLAAAVRAPTAVHEEPWAFVIIQDRDRRVNARSRAGSLRPHGDSQACPGSHAVA